MTILGILAILAAIVGIIGSIVPGLPGPPISWVGLLLAYIAKGTDAAGEPMSTTLLLVFLVLTIIVTVVDYIAPAWFTRLAGGHKAASSGAMIGLVLGMIIPPVGMIIGSLAGAFIAELMVTDKGAWGAFKASLGAFVSFLATTGMKLLCCGLMAYYVVIYGF